MDTISVQLRYKYDDGDANNPAARQPNFDDSDYGAASPFGP